MKVINGKNQDINQYKLSKLGKLEELCYFYFKHKYSIFSLSGNEKIHNERFKLNGI